jgi:hypothetical protein
MDQQEVNVLMGQRLDNVVSELLRRRVERLEQAILEAIRTIERSRSDAQAYFTWGQVGDIESILNDAMMSEVDTR